MSHLVDFYRGIRTDWLRISRILRSLTLLGKESQAQALYERLSAYFASRTFPIPADTFGYWTEAVKRTRNQQ